MFEIAELREGTCAVCDQATTLEFGRRPETLSVRKEPTDISAEVVRCRECNEFFATREQEARNFDEAYRQYRSKHKLLQPNEVAAIRRKYGLGQRAFSRLVGWGEVTLHRYESGALQDEAHNTELLLLRNPNNFKLLFERNSKRLDAATRAATANRLGILLAQHTEGQLRDLLQTLFGRRREDDYTGFRCFDLERFENLVLWVCEKSPKTPKTKLNKVLWYCDFAAYRDLRRSLTGMEYLHLPYGPVPNYYDIYLSHFTQKGCVTGEEVHYPNGITGELYRAIQRADRSIFEPSEQAVIESVIRHFARMGARAISECSHQEPAYQNTKSSEPIPYSFADQLKIKFRSASKKRVVFSSGRVVYEVGRLEARSPKGASESD